MNRRIAFGTETTISWIDYGESIQKRLVIPLCLKWSVMHEECTKLVGNAKAERPEWVLFCIDLDRLDRGVFRSFALSRILPE